MNSSILQPSTVTSWLWTRKGGLGTGSSFGGVCATATSSPPLPVCAYRNINLLNEVGSKAPSNLLHHLHSNTKHNKSPCSTGRRCAEAADCPTCCRIRYRYAACYLLLFLLGVISIVLSSVCVLSVLKNIVRSSVRYVTPRY